MADATSIVGLFGGSGPTTSEHLASIFESRELDREATIRKFRTVPIEVGREIERELDHYSLDAIIAVGYRVNSRQATQFRIRVTNTLKEFVVKVFVLDDERLKLNLRFGKDYFDELIERIRESRASESRFNLKITDLTKSRRAAGVPEIWSPESSISHDLCNNGPKTSFSERYIRTLHCPVLKGDVLGIL